MAAHKSRNLRVHGSNQFIVQTSHFHLSFRSHFDLDFDFQFDCDLGCGCDSYSDSDYDYHLNFDCLSHSHSVQHEMIVRQTKRTKL
jgi:hypothetical protein